jgi:hypothetical protein
MVSACGALGTHFVHFHGKSLVEKPERALAAAQPATDDFDCLFTRRIRFFASFVILLKRHAPLLIFVLLA